MHMATRLALGLTIVALGFAAACSSEPCPPAPAPGVPTQETATQQESARQQESATSQPGQFDVTNEIHVGIRLTILTEVLQDYVAGDSLKFAKAIAAGTAITSICNDLAIPEMIYESCDQLLLAIEQDLPDETLQDAISELRTIVPRLHVNQSREWATWDYDISMFQFSDEMRITLASSELRDAMQYYERQRRCRNLDYRASLSLFSNHREELGTEIVASRESAIAYMATANLTTLIQDFLDFQARTQSISYAQMLRLCGEKARAVLDELNKLGL